MEVAETIFNALDVVSKETGVTFAFQGCEHINRAITIEKSQYNPLTMEEVSVVQMYMLEGVWQHTLFSI